MIRFRNEGSLPVRKQAPRWNAGTSSGSASTVTCLLCEGDKEILFCDKCPVTQNYACTACFAQLHPPGRFHPRHHPFVLNPETVSIARESGRQTLGKWRALAGGAGTTSADSAAIDKPLTSFDPDNWTESREHRISVLRHCWRALAKEEQKRLTEKGREMDGGALERWRNSATLRLVLQSTKDKPFPRRDQVSDDVLDDMLRDQLVARAARGDTESIKMLLVVRTSLASRNHADAGRTALVYAGSRGHLPVLRLLVDRGVDPSMCSYRGIPAWDEPRLTYESREYLLAAADGAKRAIEVFLLASHPRLGADSVALGVLFHNVLFDRELIRELLAFVGGRPAARSRPVPLSRFRGSASSVSLSSCSSSSCPPVSLTQLADVVGSDVVAIVDMYRSRAGKEAETVGQYPDPELGYDSGPVDSKEEQDQDEELVDAKRGEDQCDAMEVDET